MKNVAVAQTENLRLMANNKNVGSVRFQKALDDGRFSSFLDSLIDTVTIGVSDTEKPALPYAGWKLIEDAGSPIGTIELELNEFLLEGEDYVKGDVMRERARKFGFVLGERHARALLARQNEIPESWRKFYLVFPGTVWQDGRGSLGVPGLDWDGGQWVLDFDWLEGGFSSDDRVVAPRSS